MGAEGEGGEEDPERLAAELQRQQEKIRQEEEKLKQMMQDVEASSAAAAAAVAAGGDGAEGGEAGAEGQGTGAVDENSIYVGQVDYEVTPEELQAHFQGCGTINRVTILCDKFTGRPKGCVRAGVIRCVLVMDRGGRSGQPSSHWLLFHHVTDLTHGCRFAYVEFLETSSVDNAMKLDNSLLKGRPIKVHAYISAPYTQTTSVLPSINRSIHDSPPSHPTDCHPAPSPFPTTTKPQQVMQKRQNVHGFNRGRGGRGGRGGFRGRGGYGFRPRGRGYRGGFRGFHRGFHPYY